MVGLELQYLFEIGRTRSPAREVLDHLQLRIQLEQCDLPFRYVSELAWRQSWTRDPFDRLIVSQAKLAGEPLLTKDATILAEFDDAVWG